jgi:hypothetical protein
MKRVERHRLTHYFGVESICVLSDLSCVLSPIEDGNALVRTRVVGLHMKCLHE